MRTLLRERQIDFCGRYYTLRDYEIAPSARDRGPPLMIGSRGPQMLATTLPHVEMWNGWYAWSGNTTAGYATLHAEIVAAVETAGRRPDEIERTMTILLRYPEKNGPVGPRATLIQGDVEVMAEALLRLPGRGRTSPGRLEPCAAAAVDGSGGRGTDPGGVGS